MLVDDVDDEDIIPLDDSRAEADALQKNLEKTRRNSIKGFFNKTAHVVSNVSNRKQKHPAEQGNAVKVIFVLIFLSPVNKCLAFHL